MESRRMKRVIVASCTLMLCGFLSGTLAEELGAPVVDVGLDFDAALPALAEEGSCEEVGLIIGPNCLPSTAISCAGLPVPVGGSCSCSSQVLNKRCKSCDPRFKGVVLQTTCIIRPAPCTGNCDIQAPITRTGLSCVPTL